MTIIIIFSSLNQNHHQNHLAPQLQTLGPPAPSNGSLPRTSAAFASVHRRASSTGDPYNHHYHHLIIMRIIRMRNIMIIMIVILIISSSPHHLNSNLFNVDIINIMSTNINISVIIQRKSSASSMFGSVSSPREGSARKPLAFPSPRVPEVLINDTNQE